MNVVPEIKLMMYERPELVGRGMFGLARRDVWLGGCLDWESGKLCLARGMFGLGVG